jgi:hypothetical protein
MSCSLQGSPRQHKNVGRMRRSQYTLTCYGRMYRSPIRLDARGGKHTPDAPCDGSALKGWLSVDSIASWVKEIRFPGGQTNQRQSLHDINTCASVYLCGVYGPHFKSDTCDWMACFLKPSRIDYSSISHK